MMRLIFKNMKMCFLLFKAGLMNEFELIKRNLTVSMKLMVGMKIIGISNKLTFPLFIKVEIEF